MPNQFSERYSSYSTSELLTIQFNKDDYQSEAIIAAEEELSKRLVTDDERELVASEIENTKQKQIQKEEKIQAYKSTLVGNAKLFLPVANRTPVQVLNVFCVFTLVSFFIATYKWVKYLAFVFSDEGSVGFYEIFIVLALVAEPILVYGLYKRKLIAWKIQQVLTTGLLISYIFSGYSLLRFWSIFPGKYYAEYVWNLDIYGILFYFINSEIITSQFDVDDTQKKKLTKITVLLVSICCILFYLAAEFF